MKTGDLVAKLTRSNPWWRNIAWEAEDRDLEAARAAPFAYHPDPLAGLTPGGLYMLRGPRRVGKSTEVKRAIADLLRSGVPARRVLHIAVDGWRAQELDHLVRTAAAFLDPAESGARYWFIDEITAVQGDWPSQIKWLRDNDPDFAADTVVLTGSSAVRLDDAIKSFAGRRGRAVDTDRALLPMSFANFCRASRLVDLPEIRRIRPDELASKGAASARELLPWIHDLVTAWEVYLQVGGFPQAVASWVRDREVGANFLDALWDVVYGDALSSRRATPLQSLALMRAIAQSLCSPLNTSNIARAVDIGRATVDAIIQDLVRSYLLWPVHREHGLGPHLRAQAKYYFSDPTLARLAARRQDLTEPDLTQLTQQQVGIALLRSIARHDPGVIGRFDALMYYRSETKAEIDFVGSALGGACVESKYVDERWGRELQTAASSPWYPVVTTRGGVELRPDALVIPAPVLALMLGA